MGVAPSELQGNVTHWCSGGLGACINVGLVVIEHLGAFCRPHTALLVMDD
jgi:hypothetical protein